MNEVTYSILIGTLPLFFLLLVSLSEILPFAIAYTLSAIACTALLGGYISGILDNVKTGKIFSVMMLMMYGILYIIISSEDNALLMGSLLLFMALGTVMMITRHIDWYNLSQPHPRQ